MAMTVLEYTKILFHYSITSVLTHLQSYRGFGTVLHLLSKFMILSIPLVSQIFYDFYEVTLLDIVVCNG
jgi:hypothetical protein